MTAQFMLPVIGGFDRSQVHDWVRSVPANVTRASTLNLKPWKVLVFAMKRDFADSREESLCVEWSWNKRWLFEPLCKLGLLYFGALNG